MGSVDRVPTFGLSEKKCAIPLFLIERAGRCDGHSAESIPFTLNSRPARQGFRDPRESPISAADMTTDAPSAPAIPLTPAGLQSSAELMWRRIFVATLNVATYWLMADWMAGVLGHGGWSVVDMLMMLCFLIGLPWTVLGFWNAVIGLWLLKVARDPLAETAPYLAAAERTGDIKVRTAVFMTVRNEDPERAFKRFDVIRESTLATGQGAAFGWFVLSDTPDGSDAAQKEEAAFAAWKESRGNPADLVYRRRTENTGYKAGNVRDFCERWGDEYELMLPLDADSLMSGEAIVKLVRVMEAYPKIGILQSLVVGMPSQSAFARIFQFGMRHGNAQLYDGAGVVGGRLRAFLGPQRGRADQAVPRRVPSAGASWRPAARRPYPEPRSGGGHIHAPRRLRVPGASDRDGELGGEPAHDPRFHQARHRWCQGNMQYWPLVGTPGLKPMSRFQLAWAILMFLGTPAWTLFIALAAIKPFMADAGGFPMASAVGLYIAFLLMYLSPKIAGFIDILASSSESARYGGRLRFIGGAATELVFSFLLGAVSTFRVTIFMVASCSARP